VYEKRIWPELFDGFFYTATMRRSTFVEYYDSGRVKESWYYDNQGNMTHAVRYDESGNKTQEAFFKNGKKISAVSYRKRKTS
jgi:YD repeat-containing protein